MHRISPAIAFALALLPFPAIGQETGVLAEFWADSGSLPPEYAWATDVTILTDGHLTLRYCVGYETEGPACKTRKAMVDDAHRAAILAAVAQSELVERPARISDELIVGGGSAGGKVFVEGVEVALPAFPVDADTPRVALVIDVIREAIPERFRNRYFDRD